MQPRQCPQQRIFVIFRNWRRVSTFQAVRPDVLAQVLHQHRHPVVLRRAGDIWIGEDVPDVGQHWRLEQLRFSAQVIARADGRPIVRRASFLENQSHTITGLQCDVQAFVRRARVAKRSNLRPFNTRDWPQHPTQRGRVGEVCHARKVDCPNAIVQAQAIIHDRHRRTQDTDAEFRPLLDAPW